MGCSKLIVLILIPAMLAGQNGQLSDAARRLKNKPRWGRVELTWVDGRREDGRIVFVTDRFVTFETDSKPSTCKDVELSEVAEVHWLTNPSNNAAEAASIIILAPFALAFAIGDQFRRLSPPVQPLEGDWKSQSLDGVPSSLSFRGSFVRGWGRR